MFWQVVYQIVGLVVAGLRCMSLTPDEKDLEILLLRQQLMIVRRKQKRGPTISRLEKLLLMTLVDRISTIEGQARSKISQLVLLFKPDTILRWHRELVKRKWTYQSKLQQGGRPPLSGEIEERIVRLYRENRWGAGKIQGELQKLGYRVSEPTKLKVLKAHNLPNYPDRDRTTTWQAFLGQYGEYMLACDFFTVETLCLHTYYVLFFIEIGTRRIHISGATTNPNAQWVTQQARQLLWKLEDNNQEMRYLIHDRDGKFGRNFDAVFRSANIKVIKTPVRAPNANAYAERWIRSIREECLDRIIVLNQNHLMHVLKEYETYYNEARPHQGIHQAIPVPHRFESRDGPIQRRKILGGLLNDYHRAA
jgi:transposase InsO family protein